MSNSTSKKISLFSLVFLIVVAIDSIRNLPSVALFGSSLIFFYLFGACIFLFPLSLVTAELTARFPEEGGVFHWVRRAFGLRCAFIAVWLQWINTMVWYPTILSFLAGTVAYLFNPDLAESRLFLSAVILGTFWALTLWNLLGLHVSVALSSWCCLLGTLLPMLFLILLGILWFFSAETIYLSFDTIVPSLTEKNDIVSLIAIMASFVGMELAGVHVNDVHNPQKNFPRAMAMSVVILLTTLILGSLSIAAVIPSADIHLVDGIMQGFRQFLDAFGLGGLVPILALLIVAGTVGSMVNWLISPAKGLLQAAQYNLLPAFFLKTNRHNVPHRILITQALLVSFFCLAFLFLPSVNGFYWFLTNLSTELYMMMYVLLFAAAVALGKPAQEHTHFQIKTPFRLPVQMLGMAGCLLTIAVSYWAPEGIDVGSPGRYALLVLGGTLLSLAPAIYVFFLKRL